MQSVHTLTCLASPGRRITEFLLQMFLQTFCDVHRHLCNLNAARDAQTLAMQDTGSCLTTKIRRSPGYAVCCPGRMYQREITSTVCDVKSVSADREGKREARQTLEQQTSHRLLIMFKQEMITRRRLFSFLFFYQLAFHRSHWTKTVV